MFIIKIKAVSSINNWPPMSTRCDTLENVINDRKFSAKLEF